MKKFWAFYAVLPSVLVTVLLAVGFAAPSAAAPGLHANETGTRFRILEDAPDPNETFRLVNEVRKNNGLQELAASSALGDVAADRAEDMAARRYYAHKSPDGTYYYDLIDRYGIDTGFNCENLDLVFVPNHERVIQEWMGSLNGHKGCMMSANVTHAGYAARRIVLVDFNGKETPAYLVVAIHAFLR